jgi:hypothetical protein
LVAPGSPSALAAAATSSAQTAPGSPATNRPAGTTLTIGPIGSSFSPSFAPSTPPVPLRHNVEMDELSIGPIAAADPTTAESSNTHSMGNNNNDSPLPSRSRSLLHPPVRSTSYNSSLRHVANVHAHAATVMATSGNPATVSETSSQPTLSRPVTPGSPQPSSSSSASSSSFLRVPSTSSPSSASPTRPRLPSSLRVLLLSDCNSLRRPIIECSTLTILSLSSCNGLRGVTLMTPSLTDLDVCATPLRDVDLCGILATTPLLSRLRASDTAGIQRPSLRQLDASSQPNGEYINLNSLISLDVSRSGIDAEGLVSFLLRAPKLRTLHAAQCSRLTDCEPFDQMIPHQSLRTLSLNGNALTDDSVAQILHVCPKVSSLNLESCAALTGTGIGTWPPRIVTVHHHDNEGDEQLLAPPIRTSLTSLNVSSCRISDDGLMIILATCPSLLKMSCHSCLRLESPLIIAPVLTSLSLAGSIHLSSIRLRSPKLEVEIYISISFLYIYILFAQS